MDPKPMVKPSDEIVVVARGILQRRETIAVVVQDLERLLRVSDQNLRTVSEQPWYGRIWGTVTGNNKQLVEQSEANLQAVQARALQLLTVLADMDEQAARCIACLQQQVVVLTWSNLETKGHLEELVTRCANRFSEHERRILNVESDTRLLRWVNARFDERKVVRYDEMPLAKRLVLMVVGFVEVMVDGWRERDVSTLLNAIEHTHVRLDDAVSLTSFATDLYQDDLVLGRAEELDALVDGRGPTDGAGPGTLLHALVEPLGRDADDAPRLAVTLEALRGQGLDLDAKITVGSLVRLFLNEFKLRRLANAGAGGREGASRRLPRRPRSKGEYWHRRAEKNELKEDTQQRAQALLRADAKNVEGLNAILELYDAASAEIDGRQLDEHLLRRMADISIHLPVTSIPAARLVEHAKRLFQYGSSQASYEWHAQLVDAAPDHPELRNNLGFILLFLGDFPRAKKSLERATELGFDTAVHWVNRGVVDALVGDNAAAEKHLRRAVEQAQGVVAAEVVLLLNESEAGDVSYDRVFLTGGSSKAIARCNLGYVLHKRSMDGASVAFDEAVQEEKKLSFAYRAAGWFCHSLDQHRRARLFFGQAKQREPQHPMNEWEAELLPCFYFFEGGRNDPCCCGSDDKFKNCCEKFIK